MNYGCLCNHVDRASTIKQELELRLKHFVFPKRQIQLDDSELVIDRIEVVQPTHSEEKEGEYLEITDTWNPKAHYREKIHPLHVVGMRVTATIPTESRV